MIVLWFVHFQIIWSLSIAIWVLNIHTAKDIAIKDLVFVEFTMSDAAH